MVIQLFQHHIAKVPWIAGQMLLGQTSSLSPKAPGSPGSPEALEDYQFLAMPLPSIKQLQKSL